MSSGSHVAGANKTAVLINLVPRQSTVQDTLEGRTFRCKKQKKVNKVKKKKMITIIIFKKIYIYI